MLSRTAENLYWTGRYMERAENMARVLDVSDRLSVQSRSSDDQSEWNAVLSILEARKDFDKQYDRVSGSNVVDYLTLNRNTLASIWSCVRAARENARALRATISVEMWESLNTTWLTLRDMTLEQIQHRGLREFFDWVKERSHLFRGVAHGTMLHNEAYGFIRLGTFIERADNTTRLLDTKYYLLGGMDGETDPATQYYEWGAVLRSVGAFRAYHQTYHDVITPERVAELLVLRPDMPRSLRFCFDRVTTMLAHYDSGRVLESERLSGEFAARLRYGQIGSIFKEGLHPFLMEAQDRIAAVSDQVARDFMMTV